MENQTVVNFAVGTRVRIYCGGRLTGLIVDYEDNDKWVVAFPSGQEFTFARHLLILA